MTKYGKLKIIYCLYLLLILMVIALIAKFIIDFYSMAKDIDASNNTKVEFNKFIINPRLQSYEENFTYIEADRGYLNYDNYIFENVVMHGSFGTIKSGKLDVKDNKNIFEFTIDPDFTIYIDNIDSNKN